MPRPHSGIRRALALLLGLVLVLSGCSAIPRSGPVQALQVENVAEGQGSTFSPPGPKVDAHPREIIEGFIEAGIAPQDDYKVAREFLNPKQNGVWKGSVQTLVYDARPSVIPGSRPSTFTIQLEVVAQIDANGVMTELPPHSTRAVDMTLEKLNGQWKISELPDGTMIDRDSFIASNEPYTYEHLEEWGRPVRYETLHEAGFEGVRADAGHRAGPAGGAAAVPRAVRADRPAGRHRLHRGA